MLAPGGPAAGVTVQWCGREGCGQPARAPEELRGSAEPRRGHPLATEMLGLVSWGCEWPLCVRLQCATGSVLPTQGTAFA